MARRVTVSTTCFALDVVRTRENALTKRQNLKRAEKLLRLAAKRKSDIVCLPECFAMMQTFKPFAEQAERVPEGETSTFISRIAKEARMYIIAPIYELRRGKVYNSALLFDRRGKVVGRYLKTHLPNGERGIAAGDGFPVLKTDFGRIAMLTCYDLNYPEAARILRIKGAEIIFWPTMWSGPSEYFCEATLRVRAMENLVYFVSSNYCRSDRKTPYRNSYIINYDGTVLASTGPFEGVATAEIDLDAEKVMQASEEDLLKNHRRPEIYGEILRAWRKRK